MRTIDGYQCPGNLMQCPTPDNWRCKYTRESRAEFDEAQPGDPLHQQHSKLMCKPAQQVHYTEES